MMVVTPADAALKPAHLPLNPVGDVSRHPHTSHVSFDSVAKVVKPEVLNFKALCNIEKPMRRRMPAHCPVSAPGGEQVATTSASKGRFDEGPRCWR